MKKNIKKYFIVIIGLLLMVFSIYIVAKNVSLKNKLNEYKQENMEEDSPGSKQEYNSEEKHELKPNSKPKVVYKVTKVKGLNKTYKQAQWGGIGMCDTCTIKDEYNQEKGINEDKIINFNIKNISTSREYNENHLIIEFDVSSILLCGQICEKNKETSTVYKISSIDENGKEFIAGYFEPHYTELNKEVITSGRLIIPITTTNYTLKIINAGIKA